MHFSDHEEFGAVLKSEKMLKSQALAPFAQRGPTMIHGWIYMDMHEYAWIHMYMYVHACICMYMHVCMHVYVCMYMHLVNV